MTIPVTTHFDKTAGARVPKGLVWVALWLALFLMSVLSIERHVDIGAATNAWWVFTVAVGDAFDIFILFVAVRLSEHYPLGRDQPLRNVGPHALAAVVSSILSILLEGRIAPAIDHVTIPDDSPLLTQFAEGLLSYAIVAGVGHGITYLSRYRRSQATALRLRAEVAETGRRRAEAELRALKSELNPHFLGKALSAVSSLIRTDIGAADRALAELGDLLRSTISRVGAQEVTLEEEIDDLGSFIALERTRYGDLAVNLEVEGAARRARLPLMILQVLVDSALKHGSTKQRPATVTISAHRGGASADELKIEVACIGADFRLQTASLKHADGTLAHLQARLRELYGPKVGLELETSPEYGAVARLTLPWREDDTPRPEQQASAESVAASRGGISLRFALTTYAVLFFLAFAGSLFDDPGTDGARATLGAALALALHGTIVTTAMLYVAAKLTLRKASWRAHGIAVALFVMVLLAYKIVRFGTPHTVAEVRRALGSAIGVPFFYGIAAAICSAAIYARHYRSAEAAEMQLRVELANAARRRAEAELRALKMELNPHFLGNSLATVASLARTDPDAAERVLTELADLLRAAVAGIDIQEVTLGEEIRGLAPFLAVERARFGDRLVVSWDVEAETLDARVPHMILQPLVENAVKHGLSPRGGPGHIVVAGHRAGEKLELSVRDDGVGLNGKGAARDWRGGVGLANARDRLEQLYGGAATLELLPAPGAGTIARLKLPWR